MDFLYSPKNTQSWSEAHPAFCSVGTPGACPPWVKRLRCEVKHSSQSSVEVKNQWFYTSTPPPYAFVVCTGTLFPVTFLCLLNIVDAGSSVLEGCYHWLESWPFKTYCDNLEVDGFNHFSVLTRLALKLEVFWDVTPCRLTIKGKATPLQA